MDLGHVVGRVRRGLRVGEHWGAITTDVDGARTSVVLGLNSESMVVVRTAAVLGGVAVAGEDLVAHALLLAVAAEDEEHRNTDEGSKDEAEDQQKGVDHLVGAVILIGREVGGGGSGENLACEIGRTLRGLTIKNWPANVGPGDNWSHAGR